ncbi:hypothetical protein [Streptomyces sp. WAC06614]|uniref:hypothetical protein n=1 Tax=Streptomyces sp. WAC06614 TaxID=2487416 RepID=UPI000F7A6720|nr:hypothetical protein [Streptomyces sp. WAC06614]RSS78239.1 hypothetical protein EF918_21745 [Streptomyces sp. WAC06614]
MGGHYILLGLGDIEVDPSTVHHDVHMVGVPNDRRVAFRYASLLTCDADGSTLSGQCGEYDPALDGLVPNLTLHPAPHIADEGLVHTMSGWGYEVLRVGREVVEPVVLCDGDTASCPVPQSREEDAVHRCTGVLGSPDFAGSTISWWACADFVRSARRPEGTAAATADESGATAAGARDRVNASLLAGLTEGDTLYYAIGDSAALFSKNRAFSEHHIDRSTAALSGLFTASTQGNCTVLTHADHLLLQGVPRAHRDRMGLALTSYTDAPVIYAKAERTTAPGNADHAEGHAPGTGRRNRAKPAAPLSAEDRKAIDATNRRLVAAAEDGRVLYYSTTGDVCLLIPVETLPEISHATAHMRWMTSRPNRSNGRLTVVHGTGQGERSLRLAGPATDAVATTIRHSSACPVVRPS